ncbi:MAG: HEAT repeat domain-containing protein [Candidatus Desantisbacteria bacterium]
MIYETVRITKLTGSILKDTRAVEPLIKALGDSEWSVREAAAEALITIYKTSTIKSDRNKILSLRKKIITPHNDQNNSDCSHSDSGIGVEFPL